MACWKKSSAIVRWFSQLWPSICRWFSHKTFQSRCMILPALILHADFRALPISCVFRWVRPFLATRRGHRGSSRLGGDHPGAFGAAAAALAGRLWGRWDRAGGRSRVPWERSGDLRAKLENHGIYSAFNVDWWIVIHVLWQISWDISGFKMVLLKKF